MFVNKFVLLGTLIVNIALSEEIDDDIRVNVHRPKQLPTYAYNHPPQFDLSDDIYVGQKEGWRRERSVESTTPDPLPSNPNRTLKSQSDLENKSQIPISVVYENNTSGKISNPAGKIRRRKQKNRHQNISNTTPSNKLTEIPIVKTENLKEENMFTTSKSVLLKSVKPTEAPSHDVTTFPKRPIEDSKRVEFQKRGRTRAPVVKILDESNFVYAHTGNFHYSYDSADGTKVSSRGELRNVNNESTGEAVIGNVSYKDQEGNDFSLSYTADENGYRPVGAHLPTPPPIPPAIARALRYLATKTPDEVTEVPEKKTQI